MLLPHSHSSPMGIGTKNLKAQKKLSKVVSPRAHFILKLHVHAIITEEDSDIVQWSFDGSTFTVKQPEMFEKCILPKLCSHKTYSSFERQMHFYRYVIVLLFFFILRA